MYRGALLVVAGALGITACSSSTAAPKGPIDGSVPMNGGATGTGGTTNGGPTGSGGASVGGANGGKTSGGASGTGMGGNGAAGGGGANGGAAGSANGGCRDDAACGMGQRCLDPYAPYPYQCGGVRPWCGLCVCPSVNLPTGAGRPCQAGTDCPAKGSAPHVASSCVSGSCTECTVDSDCTAIGTPICGWLVDYTSPFARGACVECRTDKDCSAAKPHCVWFSDIQSDKHLAGTCGECLSDAECTSGVCSNDHLCVPQCTADADCGDPLKTCSAQKRCVPRSCASPSACPAFSGCTNGFCVRTSCKSDSACPGGSCVNGACYDVPGHCIPASGPA